MTAKELDKKFPFAGKEGICFNCAYINICDKILPGYNKPGKCGGPFYVSEDSESSEKLEDSI